MVKYNWWAILNVYLLGNLERSIKEDILQVRHKSTSKVYAMKLLSKFEMIKRSGKFTRFSKSVS